MCNATTHDVKTFIRQPYAWPGGYPLFAITDDGAAICKECCRTEWRSICAAIRSQLSDGWRVVATDVNWEDTQMYCAHCSALIDSAYGSD